MLTEMVAEMKPLIIKWWMGFITITQIKVVAPNCSKHWSISSPDGSSSECCSLETTLRHFASAPGPPWLLEALGELPPPYAPFAKS